MKYDAIVIGSGAAGVYFALSSAKKGKKIAIVEKDKLGGTAFATGCLPVKKMMDKIKAFQKASFLEKEGLVSLNTDKNLLYRAGQKTIEPIEGFIKQKLDQNKIDCFIGEAKILSNKTIMVNEQIIEGNNIIIATGTMACGFKNGPQIDEDMILSHVGIFNMKDLPKNLTILGGNVEGIEFASMLSELGVEVCVIEREDEILKGNDKDLISNIKERLISNGVKLILGRSLISIEKIDGSLELSLDDNQVINTSKLLITGIRKTNIPNGLTDLNIELENGYIKVDQNLMTNKDSIYAIGDVNGLHGMAHIAIQQGILLSDHIWNQKNISFDYESLPRCIFTLNELAGAGMQEGDLTDIEVRKIYLKDTFRGFENTHDDGFIKIIIKDQIIKGLWINSIDGGSLIGSIGLWIDKEINIDQIKRSLFINPTLSEGLIDAII